MAKKPWWLAALTGDPIISGISYLLFGGNGTEPEVEARTKEQAAAGMAPGDAHAAGPDGVKGPGWFSSLIRKYTGSGLTSAEQEQNQFNSDQALLDWQRSEQSADNALARQRELRQTAFQDTVSDAAAAGINPYFAVSGSATGVSSAPQGSSHAASGSAPASGAPSLDTLLNLIFAGQRFKLTKAEIRNTNAQAQEHEESARNIAAGTVKTGEETEGIRLDNEWKRDTIQDRKDSVRLANDLTRNQTREIDKAIEKMDQEISTLSAQELAFGAKAMLDNMTAYRLAALLPYEQRLMSAQSEQARASAAYSLVAAAYQQKVIDSGVIDNNARLVGNEADAKEYEAKLQQFTYNLQTGDSEGIIAEDGFSRFVLRSAASLGALLRASGISLSGSGIISSGTSTSTSTSTSTIIK